MCGIAGFAGHGVCGEADSRLADAMLQSLAHRGPDDHRLYCDDGVILGARRLSIIDLDTGQQPLANEDKQIWATQNGEVYNYVELRADLAARGHIFRTKCDTETIVHAYEEFGDAFPTQLRGMFAIALWDRRQRRLLLTRDRLGKKPLYWRLADGRLSYASELKALLADPAVSRDVDPTALALYLQYQYIPAPHTIFKGIHKLPPATTLTWDGGVPHVDSYWTPSYEPKRAGTLAQHTQELLELLRESVRLRLRSDVPLGVFLSGGMDSSVITALMVEASSQPVRSFSIGFQEEAYNELPYARAVARHLGTDHSDDIVTIDAVEMLPKLAYHFDEPFGDPSAMPTYRVAELAASELKVVLTGDGGDESFGGYGRYLASRRLRRLASIPFSRHLADTAHLVFSVAPVGPRLRKRGVQWQKMVRMSADERYVRSMSVSQPEETAELLGRDVAFDQSAYLSSALAAGPSDPVNRLLHGDLVTYLPEDLLVKIDRATMARSLEARSPLLDHVVVEFAASLPSIQKISGTQTKVILRAVANQLLPSTLVERPKKGFGIPMREWFHGQLGDLYTELVLSPNAACRPFISQRAARSLLDRHRQSGVSYAHHLWDVLMLEQWARTWL
ncbi:MAG: asparagine synthase (glutamine-hydrolyzing) [Chloroflexi bacterium]|nr:asparagine synthase (glutamine-hydrolyzing) [Chloroflexota bacterium]